MKNALKITFSMLTIIACALGTKAEADAATTTSTTTGFVMTSSTTTLASDSLKTWPAIRAESAIVYDPIQARVLYEKNADQVRPIASIVKLMTASVADTVLSWSAKLETTPIRVLALKNEDKADTVLQNGSRWMPRDLLSYMLIGSSNKAAETIASSIIDRNVFLSLMNHSAAEWGLKNTKFFNASGLSILQAGAKGKPAIETPGNLSTAREVAVMMQRIIENHDDLLDSTISETATFSAGAGKSVTVKNTNESLADSKLGNLPIVFGKTGFTQLAGGNLAVMIQRNPQSNPYIIVVLGSTVDDRYTDVASLAAVAETLVSYQQ